MKNARKKEDHKKIFSPKESKSRKTYLDCFFRSKRIPPLGKGNQGRSLFSKREILILNTLNEKDFKLTLAHELIHASFCEIGFHDRLVRHFKTPKNEEMVDKLASTLGNTLMKKSLFYLKTKSR